MTLLPLWYKGLTPELRRKAEVTLGETTNVKAKALVDFRRLINEQQDIYSRLDEVFLLRFLRTKKYDVQKAFKVFRNYYAFRAKQAGAFTGLKPSDLKKVFEMNNIFYSPYRLPSGSHVALYRMGTFDVTKANAQDLVSAVLLIGELILDLEATQVSGGVIIVDLKGMTFHHYTQFFTVNFISFCINAVQDCMPERLKSVHFVNEPFAFHAVYRVVRPLLRKKMRDRLHFHGDNYSELQEHVPKDFLPKEYGGHLGPFNNKEFKEYIYDQEPFFERINKYGIINRNTLRRETIA